MGVNAAIDNATSARLFPLFADLRGGAVLVFGGGTVARHKVAVLLETGAKITEPAWLDGVVLVVAASAPDRRRGRRAGAARSGRRTMSRRDAASRACRLNIASNIGFSSRGHNHEFATGPDRPRLHSRFHPGFIALQCLCA
ncbi:MAG TPA: NAD(P)-dependent oxidoreductase [Rhodanobacteraceae bacterium]|jgi:hypothetical protein|nr:NAD(P)-dependent oxidoreductase [Rhodanobacteraceae bacterium]